MTIERDFDAAWLRALDTMAEKKGYLLQAERRLESEFTTSPPRARGWYSGLLAAGMAAAVIAFGLFGRFWLMAPAELTASVSGTDESVAAGSWISSPKSSPMSVAFSDGSVVALDENTELRVQALKKKGAHLLLERGKIDVSVAHLGRKDWTFDAGPYRVHVTGTRFDVRWSPESKVFSLDLEEGSVRVEGPMMEAGEVLEKGNRVRASLRDQVAEITRRDTVQRIASKQPEPDDSTAAVDSSIAATGPSVAGEARSDSVHPMVPARARRQPTWRELVRKGKYEAAVSQIRSAEYERIMTGGNARDLMLLGDAGRLSDNTKVATEAYLTVRKRFSGSVASERAAFMLGRVALEQNNNPLSAAKWFDACYRENSDGAMAREAAGRLMEAFDRAGKREKARTAAQRYANRYPQGPHRKLAEKIISAPAE